jgi:hypothetical protein
MVQVIATMRTYTFNFGENRTLCGSPDERLRVAVRILEVVID